MIPKEMLEAFEGFANAAHFNDILDTKVSLVAALASALAIGCEPCTENFLGRAREAGLTDDEIGAVAAIAMCVNAGSVRAKAMMVLEDQEDG